MKVELNAVTCKDVKAYNALIGYLMKVSEWKNFDEGQYVNVYVDAYGDIIGFDSQKYRLQFVNSAHKLADIISSPLVIPPVPFSDFKAHMLSIGADLPF